MGLFATLATTLAALAFAFVHRGALDAQALFVTCHVVSPWIEFVPQNADGLKANLRFEAVSFSKGVKLDSRFMTLCGIWFDVKVFLQTKY